MIYFRVSKYNPIYRNEEGYYLKDDWLDFSDVGHSNSGELLTMEKYIETESAYVNVALDTARILNVKTLQLKMVERHNDEELGNFFGMHPDIDVKNDKEIEFGLFDEILRLLLRGAFWAKLVSERLEIHFGYDYYMYIGVIEKLVEAKSIPEKHGLFIENRTSPYIESEDDMEEEYDSDD